MRTFGLTDPLPTGTTVLEASAGTGKTFAIAALATRYIAEGRVSIADLLLVTFSRAATAELRTRVRARLQQSAAALLQVAGGAEPAGDEVDRLLSQGDPRDVSERAARLEFAVERFDQATIMTTHEFCHGMIRGLGILAPQEPQSLLVEDLVPLADEVGADIYLRRYAFADHAPPFPWGRGRDGDDPGGRVIARDAVTVDGELGPPDADGAVSERVSFAAQVRDEVRARMKRRRLYSFDDQLTRLRDALIDPETGALARARLAHRFPVVLVDEFQDTDPVQWQVLRAAFGRDPGSALVLIGDPKQAIYAFRGADVHTYSAAARSASNRTTLTRNYRADPAVVDAVGALFHGLRLGDDIEVPRVDSHHARARLVARAGTPWASGLQVRAIEADDPVKPWIASRRVTDDLVSVVGQLLGPEPPLTRPTGESLLPGEIAILVRSNRRGAALAGALSAAGYPATFSGTDSVFTSQAAQDWLTLLMALDQPRRPFVQRAILTDFIGGSIGDLATADDDRWARWSEWLHSWGRTLRLQGVPALASEINAATDVTARLLGRSDGERAVTDHRHVAELLHLHASRAARTPRELADWLRGEIADANAASERTRRLETDDGAVQIMTIHRAKGLQFPVVLLPEASRDFVDTRDQGARVVLPMTDGRALDVGGRLGPGREGRWARKRVDDADESLRGLYVAMTRAESHVIAWWANHRDTPTSPLHRVLHVERGEGSRRPDLAYDTRNDAGGGSPTGLAWLAEAGIATVAVAESGPPPRRERDAAPLSLRVRPWTRQIDQQWRRTSYSGLTAGAHALGPADPLVVADEPADPIPITPDPSLGTRSPMALLPGGAAFGTLVHAVYEYVDARGDDWRSVLDSQVRAALRRWPLPGVEAEPLALALAPTVETPLGPLAPGLTLRAFGPRNRLAEFDFEFALNAPRATLADVAALLREHLRPDDDLADYPSRLVGPTLTEQRLHGFLTGSIDAVLRLPGGGHLIVDYKTNRLDAPGSPPEDLTVGHYSRAAMAEAMMASHYPLQALLYSVALHRYLALRLPGYDPDLHLAGAAYLFVRGMAGPATPVVEGHPTGVFSWRPTAELVIAFSRLLAGGDGS